MLPAMDIKLVHPVIIPVTNMMARVVVHVMPHVIYITHALVILQILGLWLAVVFPPVMRRGVQLVILPVMGMFSVPVTQNVIQRFVSVML
jgi:hypothetical protein